MKLFKKSPVIDTDIRYLFTIVNFSKGENRKERLDNKHLHQVKNAIEIKGKTQSYNRKQVLKACFVWRCLKFEWLLAQPLQVGTASVGNLEYDRYAK